MANESENPIFTISQIKIGDTFYNIRDAQVRESLKQVQQNVTSFAHLSASEYDSRWTLKENSEFENNKKFQISHTSGVRYYIGEDDQLWYAKAVKQNGAWDWVGGIVKNMPNTVSQCILFLQYRLRVLLTNSGRYCAQIIRKPIKQEANLKLGIQVENGFSELAASKQTCAHILSGRGFVQSTITWTDKFVSARYLDVPAIGNPNGNEYKIAINDYKKNNSNTTAQFAGYALRALIIGQGLVTTNLLPDEDSENENGATEIPDNTVIPDNTDE